MRTTIAQKLASMAGLTVYESTATLDSLGSRNVEWIREQNHGQLAPLPATRPRWTIAELEKAEQMADKGDLSSAVQLMRAARKDGVYKGSLGTLTSGIVRLPKRFRGDPSIVSKLESGHESVRSVFDEMFPATELALLAADGDELGVGVAELVPVVGRSYPVMRRLSPEFLYYLWNENRWYYRSIAGFIPITPGDGRWILHMPGGQQYPWLEGNWKAVGRNFIEKEHAKFLKFTWESILANPARVAEAPAGSSEVQSDSWLRQVAAWGVNTVFGTKPGYTVKLLESNGRGWECFVKTIEICDREYAIIVSGQTVTTDGGAGFSNTDVHKSIRADRIKAVADSLAHTINVQGIPWYVLNNFGENALYKATTVEWDVTPPKDRNMEAQSMLSIASAIKATVEALSPFGLILDIAAVCVKFGIPIEGDKNGDGVPDEVKEQTPTAASPSKSEEREAVHIELAPTDIAKVVTVNEARRGQGLGPLLSPDGTRDPDGDLTIEQFTVGRQAAAEQTGKTDPTSDLSDPKPAALPEPQEDGATNE